MQKRRNPGAYVCYKIIPLLAKYFWRIWRKLGPGMSKWPKSWKDPPRPFNTLRPRQNGRYFVDGIFKCIFVYENAWISLKISPKFVPKVRINNIPSLDQMMVCRRPGDKPLSEPTMVKLPTNICVTRPQWVNWMQLQWRTCLKVLRQENASSNLENREKFVL